MTSPIFDCIIAGGGHAGCEAAMAAARMGLATLLVSDNLDRLGHLSCNPAIGGLGKGHMVREIDAMGGMMGIWADEAAIQFRMLNAAKGPAVRAPRAQVDRDVYMRAVKRDLFAQEQLTVVQDQVQGLLLETGRCAGVRTLAGREIRGKTVCLTGGTFLRGLMHMGDTCLPGGRMGDPACERLSPFLTDCGIPLRRFMTCTPPRVLAASVDFSPMQEQWGDGGGDEPDNGAEDGVRPGVRPGFSFRGPGLALPQVPCHITWTNPEVHGIIAENLSRSPMYNGRIPGPGPRYCPSIEDKIARFPDKTRHQIFIEPEGLDNPELYCNNLPTGLPLDVQEAFLHAVPGLEKAVITRPGYAIEYDCVDSLALTPALEAKAVPNLWFAGQINGTSGYEEAAAQGLWAACNMGRRVRGEAPFLPGRDTAYMAVLVDDLATRGTDEPYRMFTSRAEHRLLLREGNADVRLTPAARALGLVKDAQWRLFSGKKNALDSLTALLRETRITPDAATRERLEELDETPPASAVCLADLMRRPGFGLEKAARFAPQVLDFPAEVRAEAEIQIVYEGYVRRQEDLAARQEDYAGISLPEDMDYAAVAGLSAELREKLEKIRPLDMGQAGRIRGMTPAAISCLLIHLKKMGRR